MNHIFPKAADYNLVIFKEEIQFNTKNNGETVKQINLEVLQGTSMHHVNDCLLALSKIYQSLRDKI